MRVAFLTYSFSVHVNIKAKYFLKSNDVVYLFAMQFRQKRKELEAPIQYRENMKVIKYYHDDIDRELLLKNTWDMFKIIRKNRIRRRRRRVRQMRPCVRF